MSDSTITQDYAEQCLTYQMTLKCSGVATYPTRMPTLHQVAAMASA